MRYISVYPASYKAQVIQLAIKVTLDFKPTLFDYLRWPVLLFMLHSHKTDRSSVQSCCFLIATMLVGIVFTYDYIHIASSKQIIFTRVLIEERF